MGAPLTRFEGRVEGRRRQRVSPPISGLASGGLPGGGLQPPRGPLVVESYEREGGGYDAAVANLPWESIDRWANTPSRTVVLPEHMERLYNFTTRLLLVRRDSAYVGFALLCEPPNDSDVCDTLHCHRNPSLPLIRTSRMTNFAPIRASHVRHAFDRCIAAHPISEVLLIAGERGCGGAIMTHLKGLQRILFASVIPGCERTRRFYERYFVRLSFERADGELPYVTWLAPADSAADVAPTGNGVRQRVLRAARGLDVPYEPVAANAGEPAAAAAAAADDAAAATQEADERSRGRRALKRTRPASLCAGGVAANPTPPKAARRAAKAAAQSAAEGAADMYYARQSDLTGRRPRRPPRLYEAESCTALSRVLRKQEVAAQVARAAAKAAKRAAKAAAKEAAKAAAKEAAKAAAKEAAKEAVIEPSEPDEWQFYRAGARAPMEPPPMGS